MGEIPNNFHCYKQLPLWKSGEIPQVLQNIHNTKKGVYGKINVLKGKLKYTIFTDENGKILEEQVIEAGDYGIAKPQEWHKVESIDNATIFVEFYQEKSQQIQEWEQEFAQKFPDKKPHYEVEYLASLMSENTDLKKVLDLGSGSGRNSLFLASRGYEVHSWDKNIDGIMVTDNLAKQYNLDVHTAQKNLNMDRVDADFDAIIATVSLQFLEKISAKVLIQSMQKHTNIGGYNLIIVPTLSNDVPCSIYFSNMIPYEEYLDFYQDWEIISANNFIGRFHRKDENGKRIASRFATIIAKKK